MKWIAPFILGLALLGTLCAQEAPAPELTFRTVHIYIDSGDTPLAAWQFEFTAETGTASLSGLENGEHPAFSDAPYYDTEALLSGRMIIAAFDTGSDLPIGSTRVATLHLAVTGDPTYAAKLMVAADSDGNRIEATLRIEEGN
jgi:hypothetical protein